MQNYMNLIIRLILWQYFVKLPCLMASIENWLVNNYRDVPPSVIVEEKKLVAVFLLLCNENWIGLLLFKFIQAITPSVA